MSLMFILIFFVDTFVSLLSPFELSGGLRFINDYVNKERIEKIISESSTIILIVNYS